MSRATSGAIWSAHDQFFRPAPLLAWHLVATVTRGAATAWMAHAVNVALHGLNASLVFALGWRLGLTSRAAGVAAVLFLCFPAHSESVVWIAGLQDVLCTTGVLWFLVALTGRGGLVSAAGAIAALVVALLSKETAVAVCVLGALMLFARERRAASRSWQLWAIAAVASVVYAAWRVALLGSAVDNSISHTRRGLEHFVVNPFASLGAPWTESDIQHSSFVACLLVCLFVLLCVRIAGASHRLPGSTRTLLLLAAVLVAVVPVGAYFYVAPDLQGSRYLYLPCVFFALALASGLEIAFTVNRANRRIWWAVTVPLCLAWAAGAASHQSAWIRAGEVRDRVLAAAHQTIAANACAEVAVVSPPDNVDGAYVFRSGALPEALRRDGYVGRVVDVAVAGTSTCRVTWK